VLLVEDGKICDVFEVVAVEDCLVKARSPFLFEIGEELFVRIEDGGSVQEAPARVRAHVGTGDDRITELELGERSDPRPMVTG
jgi:hypothetical protein